MSTPPESAPRGEAGRKERGFPALPLNDWLKWLWEVAKYYRVDRAVLIVVALFTASLLIPLIAAGALVIAGEFSGDSRVLAKLRDSYLRMIHAGFEVLHSRIDYVRDFTHEIGGYHSPRATVIKDIDDDQYVQIVIQQIQLSTLSPTVSSGKDGKAEPSTCILVERDPKKRSAGVLRVSVSGIPVGGPLGLGENPVTVTLDEAWWRRNRAEIDKQKPMGLELNLDAQNLEGRTNPPTCGFLVVDGKVSVYKNRVSMR